MRSIAIYSPEGYLVSCGDLTTVGQTVLSLLKPSKSVAGSALESNSWTTEEVELSR